MVNYKSRDDMNKNHSEEGASLIGGALDMLSQYEANMSGDEYSSKNPSDKFKSALTLTDADNKSLKDLGGSLIGGSRVGGSSVGGSLEHSHKARNHALLLTPRAFHHLTETARHIHHHYHKGSMSKTHKGDMDFTTKKGDKDFHRGGQDIVEKNAPYHGGALHDIMSAKSPHHLALMLARDHDMEGTVGGNFWDTLGSVAKTVGPLAALML